MPQRFFTRSHFMIIRFVLCIVMLMPSAFAPTSVPAAVAAPSSQAVAAPASPFYKLDVVAQTGQDTLLSIADGVSINDGGTVAFVGKTAAGESIFVGDGSSAPRPINPALTSIDQIYNPSVQINNNNLVVARDRTSGAPPVSFIRQWDANSNQTDVYSIIARSGGNFGAVLTNDSINDTGDVVFSALDSGAVSTLLATRGDWAFGYNTVTISNTVRPMISNDRQIVVRVGDQSNG